MGRECFGGRTGCDSVAPQLAHAAFLYSTAGKEQQLIVRAIGNPDIAICGDPDAHQTEDIVRHLRFSSRLRMRRNFTKINASLHASPSPETFPLLASGVEIEGIRIAST